MPERCYKCGRIKCETCGGTGQIPLCYANLKEVPGGGKCPDCDGGWQDAKECDAAALAAALVFRSSDLRTVCLNGVLMIAGDDPVVLCPVCEADKLEAAAEKHVKDAVEGGGVRPFHPVTGRSQCDVPNETNGPKEIIKRCYECGKIRCTTCQGTGIQAETLTDTGYGPLRVVCKDCKCGWKPPKKEYVHPRDVLLQHRRGTPDVMFLVKENAHAITPAEALCLFELLGTTFQRIVVGADPDVLCPACEDAADVAAAREALAEGGERMTHEELKEELGIDSED